MEKADDKRLEAGIAEHKCRTADGGRQEQWSTTHELDGGRLDRRGAGAVETDGRREVGA